MSKMIIKNRMMVVNCPKYHRIVPISGVNVKEDTIICNKCAESEKQTCGYVRCKAA